MNKILPTIQITAIILISGALGGMFYYTDIYEDVESGIVNVLCLSCIKLQPKTSKEFTFETANGKVHPNFVVDTLKTKGPIMIQYGEDGCAACDRMINNIMIPRFNLEYSETSPKSFETEVNVGNISFNYVYIYIDDENIPADRENSYEIYDKDHISGFPMFTIITIEYHHGGEIKPYYTSLYGEFEGRDYDKMYETFVELLEFSVESYDRNIAGYK